MIKVKVPKKPLSKHPPILRRTLGKECRVNIKILKSFESGRTTFPLLCADAKPSLLISSPLFVAFSSLLFEPDQISEKFGD